MKEPQAMAPRLVPVREQRVVPLSMGVERRGRLPDAMVAKEQEPHSRLFVGLLEELVD